MTTKSKTDALVSQKKARQNHISRRQKREGKRSALAGHCGQRSAFTASLIINRVHGNHDACIKRVERKEEVAIDIHSSLGIPGNCCSTSCGSTTCDPCDCVR